MSRNARTPTSRGRRIALSFGTAVGAAVVAASISMGTPPVAGADVSDADAISHLAGALDSNAVSAAGVPDVDAISHLIEAFDPNAFSSSGAPTDALGLLGYGLDTYLLGPTGLDALLAPDVDELVGSVTVGSTPPSDPDPVSDLIGAFDPNAFSSSGAPTDALGLLAYGLDTYLLGPTGLGDALDPIVDDWLSSLPSGAASAASVLDADPVSDLIGAVDPSAFSTLGAPTDVLGELASGLDTSLLVPTGLGAALDPIIDGLVGAGTLF
jgi:hypothetical protein